MFRYHFDFILHALRRNFSIDFFADCISSKNPLLAKFNNNFITKVMVSPVSNHSFSTGALFTFTLASFKFEDVIYLQIEVQCALETQNILLCEMMQIFKKM
jgi:hypothetical protein